MSKGFLVAVVLTLAVFAGYQQYLIESYGQINDRLQKSLAECIGLEKL